MTEQRRQWADQYEPPKCARPDCDHSRYLHGPTYCAVLGCKCDGYAIDGKAVEITPSEARALDGDR